METRPEHLLRDDPSRPIRRTLAEHILERFHRDRQSGRFTLLSVRVLAEQVQSHLAEDGEAKPEEDRIAFNACPLTVDQIASWS